MKSLPDSWCASLKQTKTDTHSKVRFLTPAEESALRKALDSREEQLRAARDRGNIWRRERGYLERPDLHQTHYVDHIKPMVLISINTGLRRGELFNLSWQDINFPQAVITIRSEFAKSGKTRHIPLNAEALEMLNLWRQQNCEEGLVFPNKAGKRLSHVKRSWQRLLRQANISGFRWHDMRHHFASSLVMAGVDLNTVRDLLGHSDIKMTLIYAHLAPEHKAHAVAKLLTWRNDQANRLSI